MDGSFNVNITYPANDSSAQFGSAVSSAGDLNGDGYSDVAVAADTSNVKCTNCGVVYIYYGGSSMDSNFDVNLTYPASDTIAEFGSSVSSGDVNGDGYSDVVVSAMKSDVKCAGCGVAYIYYGGSSMDSNFDVNLTYPASDTSSYFGRWASLEGDINGDGYSDVIVGAYLSEVKCQDCGAAYLFMGGRNTSYPVFYFANKVSGTPSSITGRWEGYSTINAATRNMQMDVYRFGATNAWVSADTNTTCTAGSECNLTAVISSSVSEYYSSSWTYWRVYQAAGNPIFETEFWSCVVPSGPSWPSSWMPTRRTRRQRPRAARSCAPC